MKNSRKVLALALAAKMLSVSAAAFADEPLESATPINDNAPKRVISGVYDLESIKKDSYSIYIGFVEDRKLADDVFDLFIKKNPSFKFRDNKHTGLFFGQANVEKVRVGKKVGWSICLTDLASVDAESLYPSMTGFYSASDIYEIYGNVDGGVWLMHGDDLIKYTDNEEILRSRLDIVARSEPKLKVQLNVDLKNSGAKILRTTNAHKEGASKTKDLVLNKVRTEEESVVLPNIIESTADRKEEPVLQPKPVQPKSEVIKDIVVDPTKDYLPTQKTPEIKPEPNYNFGVQVGAFDKIENAKQRLDFAKSKIDSGFSISYNDGYYKIRLMGLSKNSAIEIVKKVRSLIGDKEVEFVVNGITTGEYNDFMNGNTAQKPKDNFGVEVGSFKGIEDASRRLFFARTKIDGKFQILYVDGLYKIRLMNLSARQAIDVAEKSRAMTAEIKEANFVVNGAMSPKDEWFVRDAAAKVR